MIASPPDTDEARQLYGAGVTIIELPIDDFRVLDSGPVFFVDNAGHLAALPWARSCRIYGGIIPVVPGPFDHGCC
jgi:agmatine/peptidylarginine deiminase